jgi:hypothetical protein
MGQSMSGWWTDKLGLDEMKMTSCRTVGRGLRWSVGIQEQG